MNLHHGLRAAAGASPADPYFSSTSLLLLGNGTNGGQNNTFVDGSTNNFTITRNGNATQGSFTPYWPDGRWSNYFDGSGDYLSVPYSANTQLGSSDFTIEFFVYFNSVASGQRIVSGDGNSSGTLNWGFYTTSTGTLNYYLSTSGTVWNIAANLVGNISVGQWYHVALVRNGSTFTPYLNGTSGTTATTSSALYTTSTGITIGAINNGNYLNGYISNLRILKGTAQYTANFTPPTAPLTAVTNTQLLTCQSNRFIDNSTNAFAITRNGDAAVSTINPFAPVEEYSASSYGGSGYFDGSGDYLSVAAASAIQFGTGDYTIDFWVYVQQSGRQDMINMPGTNRLQVAYEGTNTAIYINNTFVTGAAVAPQVNAWNHIAATRSGTSTKVFLNGKQLGTTATNSTNFSNNSITIVDTTSGATPLKGYLSSVRLVKGGALFTADFTPPTAPPTTTASSGTVGLLLNFTNASIIDSTSKNNLETVGDAQISTSVKKYGTGSLAFDGTGDRLVIPHKPDLLLGSGDFTVEMWLYKNTSKTYMVACGNLLNANSSAWQILHDVTGNKIAWYSSFGFQLTSTTSLATSTWYHVAVVRGGTSFKLYLNGTQEASTTNSVNFNVANPLWVGHAPENTAGRDWDGYIDDLRITKGVARYTSNFTPPSAQLPTR